MKAKLFWYNFLTIIYFVQKCYGDFHCLCNYNVEIQVLDAANQTATAIGTLYEFDCKPVYNSPAGNNLYIAIQFENMIGYVKQGKQTQEQICPGEPPKGDIVTTIVPQTTSPQSTTTTSMSVLTNVTRSSTIFVTTQSLTSRSTKQTTPPMTASTRTSSTTPPMTASTRTSSTTPPMTASTRTSSTTPPMTASTRTSSATIPITTTFTTTLKKTQAPTSHSPLPAAMNVSGTPLQYIGTGYNLLRGNPDGNPYGTTTTDEGFKLNNRILKLTSGGPSGSTEAEYSVNSTSCVHETHASLLYDEQSYQNYLINLVKPSDSHPNALRDKSFTLSLEYKHLFPSGSSSDNTIYRDIITSCPVGYARYKTGALNDRFMVTEEFATAVCQLPQTYDNIKYLRFLETWGTSIVMSTQMGERTIKRYHISKIQAFDHVQKTAPALVQQTGGYVGYASSLSIDTNNYTVTQSTVNDVFGTLKSTINMGTATDPVPIHMEVAPITYALDPILWKQLIGGVLHSVCSPSFDLSTIKNNMETALQGYPSALSAPTVQSFPLRIPITWPVGTYGLMKTNTGCPGRHVSWQEGWRKHDTEDHDAANHWSPDILSYMDGVFMPNNLITRFCIKTQATVNTYDRPWPPGQYCILEYQKCPPGFKKGYLIWDDEDNDNHNEAGGTLPSGSFTSNTKIYYCCRTDGTASSSISLPTDDPFIMLRYGPECQTVTNMKVKQVYVRWDDEDTGNFDNRWGTIPYDDGGSKDHRLYFCHYQADQANVFVPGLIG